MLPRDIESIALIAINNSEWNSLNYLLNQLNGWMDCPDPSIGAVAGIIGIALDNKTKELPIRDKYLNNIHTLLKYASKSLKQIDYAKLTDITRGNCQISTISR